MALNLAAARTAVQSFFNDYGKSLSRSQLPTGEGKVYEIFCLSKTIEYLKTIPGVSVRLANGSKSAGNSVDFQASPGMIHMNRSHFVVSANGQTLTLHTDIEVETLSHHMGLARWPSSCHEIDIVLLRDAVDGTRPRHDQLLLGVECKSHATFQKAFARMALGMRRELSVLTQVGLDSELSCLTSTHSHMFRPLRADPASEFWLAYPDANGNKYAFGPDAFGISFKHWCP